ncbi:MAG: LamG domain-containing protein [Planctomycetes bacterium]|nr:LamG domain-containing protein [Planctomycetota bacterium]
MRSLPLLAAMTLAVTATAQDFIHYKFDSTCTTEVINYANGSQALAANGSLQSTSPTSPYVAGVFGSALAAGSTVAPTYQNLVVTGWDPSVQPVTGDLTMAWFMRQNVANGSPFYIMGAPSGGFRLFTGGVAGRGLYQRVILATGGNGTNASIANDFYLPDTVVDIQTLASAGWVHVAMVVDATAATATWYVNGTQALQITGVTGGASITAAGPFRLGGYSSVSHFDIDEFLMSFRAYSPAEILVLSLSQQAGDGDYVSGSTTQCGSLSLTSANGRPQLSNFFYSLELGVTAPSFYQFMFGLDRCSLGGVLTLPLDAGALAPIATGCTLLTDIAISTGGVAVSPVSQPFPILPDPAFVGVQFFAQGAAIDLTTMTMSASNGFAIAIGN